MVVQNFLLLVLSSFFQVPSVSPVCSSSVFSVKVNILKYFKLSFCSYLFIVPVFPPSFVHMRSLLALALSFKAFLSFYFMSVPSLFFLPLFFFCTFFPLPSRLTFLYFIRFHFLSPSPLPFAVFCPLPFASCQQVSAITPRHQRPIKL